MQSLIQYNILLSKPVSVNICIQQMFDEKNKVIIDIVYSIPRQIITTSF